MRNLEQQDNLRDRLNMLMDDYGTTQNFICEKTGLAPSELCRFRKETVVLNQTQVNKLNGFLTERGYDYSANRKFA